MTQIDPDTIAIVSKKIKDTNFALSALLPLITKDVLDTDYAKSLLGLIEINMADISKKIGVPTETRAEVKERFAQIRAANIRIRELEHQIGESAQIDQTIQSVKLLDEKLRRWWLTQGFGHIVKFSVKNYGAKVTLSGTLYGNNSSIFSETPVSDKENRVLWFESLIEKGYVLAGIEDPGQREIELVDCGKNRELITQFITDHLPSAEIISIANFNGRHKGFVIRDIKVLVRDLHDIDGLPSPTVIE